MSRKIDCNKLEFRKPPFKRRKSTCGGWQRQHTGVKRLILLFLGDIFLLICFAKPRFR